MAGALNALNFSWFAIAGNHRAEGYSRSSKIAGILWNIWVFGCFEGQRFSQSGSYNTIFLLRAYRPLVRSRHSEEVSLLLRIPFLSLIGMKMFILIQFKELWNRKLSYKNNEIDQKAYKDYIRKTKFNCIIIISYVIIVIFVAFYILMNWEEINIWQRI
jgi:NADH:ubiquinone oxidoreductase subunit 5 (subunit L)/multisubunit Na+/H+ antiporter MnhA subunit